MESEKIKIVIEQTLTLIDDANTNPMIMMIMSVLMMIGGNDNFTNHSITEHRTRQNGNGNIKLGCVIFGHPTKLIEHPRPLIFILNQTSFFFVYFLFQ